MSNLINLNEIENLKDTSFNKFLIVGNKYSNYKFVEKLLVNNGIKKASKLKKERIKPKAISKIILKLNDCKNDNNFTVNPMWNALAMDLFISNMNKDYWIWSDRNAVDLLNFWKTTDSNLAFILVYSKPEYFIKELIKKSPINLNRELIDKEVNRWITYNRKLLNFYYRNNDSSILVNSDQVSSNSLDYIENLQEQKLIKIVNTDLIEKDSESIENISSNDELYDYLISQLINEYQELNNIYQEMQSCANFPYIKEEKNLDCTIELLNQYNRNIEEKENIEEKYKSIQKDNEALQSQLFSVQEELKKIYLEKKDQESKLKYSEDEINKLKNDLKQKNSDSSKNKELKEENELLLTQLFSVQEELEKYYLELQNYKTKKTEIKKLYGAADRIKNQLSYRLGAKMIEKSKSFGGLLSLPFVLRSEVKKFRIEQKDKKKLPPIHTYTDAYEAEKIKKHLSYKLGYELIQCFKSPFGIFKWSTAIKKAKKEYKEGK